MTTRVPINITELDFEANKQSLIEFLKAKNSPIKDYNYEGSAFNILLDVLAANTHYHSIYSNFIANEMFLDSALLRSSVVSRAKELGYQPRSVRASSAKIKFEVLDEIVGTTSIIVPKNTEFKTNVGDAVFSYYNLYDETLDWDGEKYTGEFYIFCGSLYSQTVEYNENEITYVDGESVDTTTLVVYVQNSAYDTNTALFSEFTKMIDLTSESNVYFLKETDQKHYEISFGDGVIGKKLVSGNIIKMQFMSADSDAPYGSTTFTSPSDFYPGYLKTIECTIPSSGFIDLETTDEIRTSAQHYYQTQNRSVIASDYKYNIMEDYADIIDVNVWGGEENDPPYYGKVFVSCIMSNLSFIPATTKAAIIEVIKKKNMMNVRPVIVDPEFFDITVKGYVRYKPKQMGISAADLKILVLNTIALYSYNNLEAFNSKFAYSQLSSDIQTLDNAITSVVFTFDLSTRTLVSSTEAKSFKINFRVVAKQDSYYSARFYKEGDTTYEYDLMSDGDVINEYRYLSGNIDSRTYVRTVGTIDYDLGVVEISDIKAIPIDGTIYLNHTLEMGSSEAISGFNQVISINSQNSSSYIEVRGTA